MSAPNAKCAPAVAGHSSARQKNSKIRYIEGNPDQPVNRGVLCAKGSAGIMQHYSPSRLKKPMKRIGDRGEKLIRRN